MSAFKKRCIELRKKDYTLSEIVKATNRQKTSVYYHIQQIPLSRHKRQLILESYRHLAFKLSEGRRAENEKCYKRFSEWDLQSVLLIAHLLFDGEIHRGKCRYHSRSLTLIERVRRLVQRFCITRPKIHKNQQTGVVSISYYNASFGRYLEEKSRELLTHIRSMPKELKHEFLKAFFDDEGCMNFRKNESDRKIRGYQKNIAILETIRDLLLDFSISSTILKPNEIKIVGKDNLMKFQREIGFSLGVRINGKRSNSIWKQSLEKREILRRAIASFNPVGSNGVHRTVHN